MIYNNSLEYQLVFYNKLKFLSLLSFCILNIQLNQAQYLFVEAGLGIGRVVDKEHAFGKGELTVNATKPFKFGELGLDVSFGGNFIPNSTNITIDNAEVISSSDSKFWAISILYRAPIKNIVFIEPRFGYSNLFSFVHTDDRTRISQSNFTAGIGVGRSFNNIMLSLRYQYFGRTPNYTGVRNGMTVISNPEPLSMVLLRVSYRFTLENVFRRK